MVDFILASGSPRRKDLLLSKGYQFRVVPAGIEEWLPGKFPFHQLCEENAALKASIREATLAREMAERQRDEARKTAHERAIQVER